MTSDRHLNELPSRFRFLPRLAATAVATEVEQVMANQTMYPKENRSRSLEKSYVSVTIRRSVIQLVEIEVLVLHSYQLERRQSVKFFLL